jgi:tagatose 6-phosphate kinase
VILCVCPSPAVDLTYQVESLLPGATNRVTEVAHRPGGKAVNVARVLHTLGAEVTVLAPLDGPTGAQLAGDLAALDLTVESVPAGVPTRRTITVVESVGRHPTVLSEPARVERWPDLAARYTELVPRAHTVVISGSMPAGVPDGALAELVATARAHARPVVVDTSGPALTEALAARPTIVKPNAHELTDLTGEHHPHVAAARLARHHGVIVVASLGADGLIAVDGDTAWHARPAGRLDGNPTGAGDALVAGIALGLAGGHALPDLLAEAVALSAASVLQPHAGDIDPAHVAELRSGVVIARLEEDGSR